jgi:hypothetical protein
LDEFCFGFMVPIQVAQAWSVAVVAPFQPASISLLGQGCRHIFFGNYRLIFRRWRDSKPKSD